MLTRAATVVQVLQDLFYVLLHVLFYLWSLLNDRNSVYRFSGTLTRCLISATAAAKLTALSVSYLESRPPARSLAEWRKFRRAIEASAKTSREERWVETAECRVIDTLEGLWAVIYERSRHVDASRDCVTLYIVSSGLIRTLETYM